LYLHGHTVGGTNPSLLEAMASSALVVAHNNEFNNSILGSDAFYFTDSCQVQAIIETVQRNTPEAGAKIDSNIQKINNLYSWDKIIKEYEQMMLNCISKSSKKLALTEDL
jgi:glycosyltransferase involved in cell wall biosynthesis